MFTPEDLELNKKAYSNNDEFKEFVNKHCAKHEISVEEALTHKQITITREYYEAKKKEWYSVNRI